MNAYERCNWDNSTLSVDHRAIDGAAGAQFLQTFKSLVEQPRGMFA